MARSGDDEELDSQLKAEVIWSLELSASTEETRSLEVECINAADEVWTSANDDTVTCENPLTVCETEGTDVNAALTSDDDVAIPSLELCMLPSCDVNEVDSSKLGDSIRGLEAKPAIDDGSEKDDADMVVGIDMDVGMEIEAVSGWVEAEALGSSTLKLVVPLSVNEDNLVGPIPEDEDDVDTTKDVGASTDTLISVELVGVTYDSGILEGVAEVRLWLTTSPLDSRDAKLVLARIESDSGDGLLLIGTDTGFVRKAMLLLGNLLDELDAIVATTL